MLDRLLELRVPDQITLDSDELLSLLDEGALALDAIGVQVLWPRYLDRDVTSRVVLSGPPASREEPLQTGLFGPDALFGFSWQLALHGDALSDEEMDDLARRRDADHQDPRQLDDRRLRGAQAGPQAAHQAGGARGRAGRDADRGRAGRGRRAPGGRRGVAAQGPRPAAHRRGARADRGAGRAGGHAARLPAARVLVAGRAHRARARRLPGRRHGAGQDGAGHRAAPAPARGGRRARAGRRWWCARRRCSATGRPRSGGSRPACPSGASTGPAARWTAAGQATPRPSGASATRGSC